MSCPDEECPFKKPEPLDPIDKATQRLIYFRYGCAAFDALLSILYLVQGHFGIAVTWMCTAVTMGMAGKLQGSAFNTRIKTHRLRRLYRPTVCPRCGDTPPVPKELL